MRRIAKLTTNPVMLALVCGLAAWYTFLKDAQLWAMRNRGDSPEKTAANHTPSPQS
jgi:hypothetical protein